MTEGYVISRIRMTPNGSMKEFLTAYFLQDSMVFEWRSEKNRGFRSLLEARRFVARYTEHKSKQGIFIEGPRGGFYPLSRRMSKWR